MTDNLDFLIKYSHENNKSIVLVTFDVKGPYTSIPHKYSPFWIEKHPQTLKPKFSRKFVLQSINTITKINKQTLNNEFKNKMEFFEVYLYNIWEVKCESEFKEFLRENCSRFLVDCKTHLYKKIHNHSNC